MFQSAKIGLHPRSSLFGAYPGVCFVRKKLFILLLGLVSLTSVAALPPFVIKKPFKLKLINRGIAGEVLDFTNNHCRDNRIWSQALGKPVDAYVYLPPGYQPEKTYPVFYWLHGFTQDENCLLDHILVPIDSAITQGIIPPMVIVAPDGKLQNQPLFLSPGSFFANTKAGNYEDLLLEDIIPFIEKNYSIASGRENRIIGGVSMGGGSAARIALKYPQKFATCLGIFPPLNIRYETTRGNYLGKYVPGYWQFREDFSRGLEPMGKFFGGLVTIRLKQMLDPLYDRKDPDLAAKLAAENPTELVAKHDNSLYPLSFYIASAGKDEFNIDSQVDTFLDAAEGSGIAITVDYSPRGRHSVRTAAKMAPASIRWLGQVLGSQKIRTDSENNLDSSK